MSGSVEGWFSGKRLYAICQIMGWGIYGGLSGLIYYASKQLNLGERELMSIVFTSVAGMLITHGFRYFIKKYELNSKPITQLILIVVLSNILMGMLLMTSIMGFDKLIGLQENVEITSYFLVLAVINLTIIFVMWSLIYFVVQFVRNNRKREMDKIKWEGAMKEFELNKLKSQLNPHFVFNALNSIRSLIEEDPSKAKLSITQLSNILRSSLISDRNKIIPFSEELKTINDYLNLEKLRYEERLQPEIEVSPEALKVPVPPMMLQTLVENAVKHGIMNQTHEGHIAIRATVNHIRQTLQVEIENTGQLGSLESGGFGILNTRQRMKILYGDDAHFMITQKNENTVLVTIILPLTPIYL
jgi:two-component system, LytTR family, sensor kinase